MIAAVLLAGPVTAQQVTFYRDVLPILQNRCQECHRQGQMAPMALTTYQEARPWAKAIRAGGPARARCRRGSPIHAAGNSRTTVRLTAAERETLAKWVDSGAQKGREADAPPPKFWPEGWNIGTSNTAPDKVVEMPQAFQVPAKGAVEYQYFIVPTGFKEDRWVQQVEVRPKERSVVHHAVVYIREPGDTWTQAVRPRPIFWRSTLRAAHRMCIRRAWPSWSRRDPIW